MTDCNRKDICYNYPKDCELCQSVWEVVNGVVNCYPCFQDKDIVEVVRCKDCKYYEIHKPSVTLNCERYGLLPMLPTDFCSYGERKC